MKIKSLSVGPFEVNCYILISNKARAIVIDPGAESLRIKKILFENKVEPSFILHTHGHIDHIQADNDFSLPVYIHQEDVELLKNPVLNLSQLFNQPFVVKSEVIPIKDEQIIELDDITLKVIHTPGHTPGSSCFLFSNHKENLLFSGDTLFYLGIGRTDFVGASFEDLIKSIKEKLFLLDDKTVVYPGHGPLTQIGKEKKLNPFLK